MLHPVGPLLLVEKLVIQLCFEPHYLRLMRTDILWQVELRREISSRLHQVLLVCLIGFLPHSLLTLHNGPEIAPTRNVDEMAELPDLILSTISPLLPLLGMRSLLAVFQHSPCLLPWLGLTSYPGSLDASATWSAAPESKKGQGQF